MKKSRSGLIKKGLYYYKRVCIYDPTTKKKTEIPIKLAHIDNIEEALENKSEVERIANQLKRIGNLNKIRDYQFKWMSENGKAEFKKPITFSEGYDMFIEKRKVAESTMCMYINSLNHWSEYLPHSISCEDIDSKHLIEFVEKHKNNRADTSINMDVRVLRSMLHYLKDKNEIKEIPSFKRALKMCPINDEDPIYITELEFIELMSTNWLLLYVPKRDWYKEVFQLYWDLGIRLSEPFFSTVQGNNLCIPKDKAKNRRARKVRLTEEQKLTIIEMQRRYKDRPTIDHIKNYSKVFKKALRHCNIDESKHFHSLRHSYALRRRIETNGNWQKVAKELGHQDPSCTLKYQRCNEEDLMDDFPSYKTLLESLENGVVNGYSPKNTSPKSYYTPHSPLRQMN